jgi:hypothetical protein
MIKQSFSYIDALSIDKKRITATTPPPPPPSPTTTATATERLSSHLDGCL